MVHLSLAAGKNAKSIRMEGDLRVEALGKLREVLFHARAELSHQSGVLIGDAEVALHFLDECFQRFSVTQLGVYDKSS
jgi:hypothetical protein